MTSNSDGAGMSRPPSDPTASPRLDVAGLGIAAGLFLLAALIWWDASGYPERASYAKFGPEIFPYIVAAGLAVFAVITVVMAVRDWFPEREEMSYPPVIWVTLAVVLQLALLMFGAGFIAGSGALFGFCARGMGRKPLWLAVLVGLCFSAILYLLFRHGLGLSLPAGPLERVVDGLVR